MHLQTFRVMIEPIIYVGESVKVKETGTTERIDVNGGYWTLDGSAWTLNGVHYAAGTEVAVTSENRQS